MKYLGLYAISILLLTSCESFPGPKGELCAYTKESDLACHDSRSDKSYFRNPQKGDLVTNPDDFKAMKNYCLNLRQKLLNCRQSCHFDF